MLHSALLHATCCRIDNFAAHAQANSCSCCRRRSLRRCCCCSCCQLSVGRVAWVYANCSSFSYGCDARGERLLATHDHDHCPATALAAAASASAAQLLSSSCSGRLISIANIFTYSQCQLPQPPVSPSPAAICCPGVDNDNVAHSSCFGCIFINGLPFRFYVQLYFSLARYFSLPSTALALLHIWPLDLLFRLLLLLLLRNLVERIINNHFSMHIAFLFRVLISVCLRITICLASSQSIVEC